MTPKTPSITPRSFSISIRSFVTLIGVLNLSCEKFPSGIVPLDPLKLAGRVWDPQVYWVEGMAPISVKPAKLQSGQV